MGVQCGTSVKCLATGFAFVRLLARVDYLVTTQSAGLPEALAAYFADEWSGSSMHWHVSGQVVMGIEHLTTFTTHIGFPNGFWQCVSSLFIR